MAQIAFARHAYGRSRIGLPQAILVNLTVEDTPDGPTPDARIPRPGLVNSATAGAGPIRGVFRQAGVYGGSLFAVSGGTAYINGAGVGSIDGSDNARWAVSTSQFVVVGGGTAYLYDGSNFAQITDPDLPLVSDVAVLGARFVYTTAGSGRFYWSEVNDAGNVDGLSFATDELAPDDTLGALVVGDEIYFLGASTIEPWYQTGDSDLPFQRAQGRSYDRGVIARDAAVNFDNTIGFVGDDLIIYRLAQVPQRISNFGIEEKLKACTTPSLIQAFAATVEGHAFLVVNIPGQGSFAYDAASTEWAEWRSYGLDQFRVTCSTMYGATVYCGDRFSGTIWALTPGTYLDGTDPITFEATAFIPQPGGQTRCNNLVLQGARGNGTDTGQGSDPMVEMKYSDDQGHTFSRWRQASLGKRGKYAKRPVWQNLGSIKEPGRVVRIRTTDGVLPTMSGLLMNVPHPHG